MHTLSSPNEVANAITAHSQSILFKYCDNFRLFAIGALALALLFSVTCLFTRRYPLSIVGFCLSGAFALILGVIPGHDRSLQAALISGKNGVTVITKAINHDGWTVVRVSESDGILSISLKKPASGNEEGEEYTTSVPRDVLERNLNRSDLSTLSIVPTAPRTPPPL